MSLHAEYTSDSNTVKQLADYTKQLGANMHVHVSETKSNMKNASNDTVKHLFNI